MSDAKAEETNQEIEETTQPETFDQASFDAIKGLIQRLSIQLDETKAKQKEFKERLKNILDNDTQLAEFEQQAKDASQLFKKRKQELQESLEGKEIKAKIKEYSEEIRDIEESLTNSLLSYYQITGTQSFATPTGDEREFKLKARLMPAKSQS